MVFAPTSGSDMRAVDTNVLALPAGCSVIVDGLSHWLHCLGEGHLDHAKNLANQKKHGVSFEEARELFTSEVDCLEIFDTAHSEVEDRFTPVGPIRRGWSSSSGPSVTTTSSGSSARVGRRGANARYHAV
jgi:hypothetical protein